MKKLLQRIGEALLGARLDGLEHRMLSWRDDIARMRNDIGRDLTRLEGVMRDAQKALQDVAGLNIQGLIQQRQAEHETWLKGEQFARWDKWKREQRQSTIEAAKNNWPGCRKCWDDPCSCVRATFTKGAS